MLSHVAQTVLAINICHKSGQGPFFPMEVEHAAAYILHRVCIDSHCSHSMSLLTCVALGGLTRRAAQ
jgi:hypothetical protein